MVYFVIEFLRRSADCRNQPCCDSTAVLFIRELDRHYLLIFDLKFKRMAIVFFSGFTLGFVGSVILLSWND